MKKRGFTLVELLTVIVILGVVFLFIVPRLSTLIKKGEKNQKDILEERVLIAAKEYVSNYNRNFYDSLVNEGDYNYVYRTDLLKSGLVDENELKELGNNLVGVKGELLDNDNIKYTLAYIDNPVDGYCEDEVYLMIQQLQNRVTNMENGGGSGGADTTELREQINNLINENNELKAQVTNLAETSKILNAYPVGSIYTSTTNTNPGDIFGGTWVSFGSGRTLVGVDTTQTEFNTVEKTGGNKSVGYTPAGTVGNTALTVAQLPSHNHNIPALSGSTNSTGNHWHRTFIAVNESGPNSTREWELFVQHGTIQEAYHSMNGNWLGNTGTKQSTYVNMNYLNLANTGSTGNHAHTVTTNASNTGNQGSNQAHTHNFTGTSSNISVINPYITVYMWKRTA